MAYERGVDREKGIAFLREIRAVCEKHGVWISHEDYHGGFELQDFDEGAMDLLEWADSGKYEKP